MKKFLLSLALLMSGCATAPLMQESFYNQVAPGAPISEVVRMYGEPYEMRELPGGLQEYCYVQRIDLGRSAVEQQEFVFVVNHGIVVGKDSQRSGTSGLQISL